jgi:DNA-binding transcriptional MerR regulator
MADESLSIGDVINLLRDDFPDVSVSKIRFLEAQGLITPGRSASGYRLFGTAEVKRLRYILGLQRDHFLPLKVIKSKLTVWERGEDSTDGAESPEIDSDGEPISRQDLLRRSGLTLDQLEELQDHNLVVAETGSENRVFPSWALPAAIEARHLFALGFEARHLRQVRLAAEREAEMLRQLLLPGLSSIQAEVRERARQSLSDGAEAVSVLHRVILGSELRSLLEE